MTVAAPAWSMQPLATAPRQRWANGGGWTQELLAWGSGPQGTHPPGSPDWRLRVSVAQVDGPGPFSVLPGVARWLVPLSGGTLQLAWPRADEAERVGPGALPMGFDGGQAPSVMTIDDPPARLLNFMVRDAAGLGQMQPAAPSAPAPDTPWRAVFSEAPATLQTPDGLVCLPAQVLAWQAAGEAPPPCALIDVPGRAWWLAWWPRGT